MQSHARCGHGCKLIDSLVSEGMAADHGDPFSMAINFDGILLNVLSIVQPLHGKRVIESDWLSEGHFEHGRM